MRVCINVTEKDICKGCKGDEENCPIARAVLKNLKDGSVSVGSEGDIAVFDVEGDVVANANASTRRERFVTKFDMGEKVKPFRFLMNIPSRVVRKQTYKNQRRTKTGQFSKKVSN